MSIRKTLRISFAIIIMLFFLILTVINIYTYKSSLYGAQDAISEYFKTEAVNFLSAHDEDGNYDDEQIDEIMSELTANTNITYELLNDAELLKYESEIEGTYHFKQILFDEDESLNSSIKVAGYKKNILIRIPIRDMQHESKTEQIILLSVCLLFAGLLLVFCEGTVSQITKPVKSLTEAMKSAADGNLDVQCDSTSKNELGTLARNFNKMMHIISTNFEDLSNMHEELQANEEELRRNYDHIEFLAYHDVLTKLPNKIAFYDKVYNTLNSRHADEHKHAIYFVDLDNFKTVNDTLGHDYGDELLAQTAAKLNSMMRENDLLARAGGDEFLIFRADIDSKDEAISFGESILDAFKEPFNLSGEFAHISMSIGVSIYPSNGHNHNVLIKNADIAMYHSKDTGKNKVTIFTSEMEQQLQRESDVLDALRNAIKNNEIYLVYQPQFSSADNSITGYEALMRINSAKLGPLSPSEFIPIAESNGLINDLGVWALRTACLMNKNLLDRGYKPRKVAVNLSSMQLNNNDFTKILADILQETELPPHLLELELTESMLVPNIDDAAMMLGDLRFLGVCISLDDFGTGYSSLNYLTKMPINTLKIDKSFVDHIFEDDKDSQLAENIITLAHSLDIKVVAEGVETGAQLSLLRSMDCDLIQGFILSKPLLSEQLVMLLD